MHATFKLKQKSTADHILELAIGLPPVPGLPEYSRDSGTAFAPMFFNNPSNKVEIVLGYDPFTIGKNRAHEDICNRIFFRTHVLFQCGLKPR